MDGVLIDSQPMHYEIDIRVLKSCGFEASLETVTPFTGMSNPDRWPKYKEVLGLANSTGELIKLAEEKMREVFDSTNFSVSAGLIEFLKGLNEMGVKCAVASSSSHELIELVLNRTGIKKYFDVLVSGEDVRYGKPSPDIYLKAVKAVGLPVEKCIAIEDAAPGVLAAKRAGLYCICYKNPNTANQDFAHADFVLTHFNEGLCAINRVKTTRGFL